MRSPKQSWVQFALDYEELVKACRSVLLAAAEPGYGFLDCGSPLLPEIDNLRAVLADASPPGPNGILGYTYLATPYSHPDPEVVQERFKVACAAAARLIGNGEIVFSPIAHSHPIAQSASLPGNWEFWKRQDFRFLVGASRLLVVRAPGWEESVGVRKEIQLAKDLGIPVEFCDPEGLEN